MGICFGKGQPVHPLSRNEDGGVKSSLVGQFSSAGSRRIKVRMTSRHLKELMARADMSKGDSELGRLILEDGLEGRLGARIVSGRLDTIKEE